MTNIQVKNKKDAAGKYAASEKDLVVSCKALLQLQKSFYRQLTTSDQHVHVVLVVVAVLDVDILIVVVVVCSPEISTNVTVRPCQSLCLLCTTRIRTFVPIFATFHCCYCCCYSETDLFQ